MEQTPPESNNQNNPSQLNKSETQIPVQSNPEENPNLPQNSTQNGENNISDKHKEDLDTAQSDISQLTDWLNNIEGLNINKGVQHCGGEEAYLDVLGVFAISIASASKEIKAY